MQSQFPDGVWLIELSGVAPSTPDEAPAQMSDRVAIAIAQTLGLAFHGTTPPATQVANFLSMKTTLLILDSFEHLLDAAP